jgi:hypothetical protein
MIKLLLENKIILSRIITILLILSLVYWEGVISISQYCFCDMSKPQLELSSSTCNNADNCCSEVMQSEKISGGQKLVNQRCVNSFSDQIPFFEESREQNIKQIIDIAILGSHMVRLSEIAFQNLNNIKFISHNRFIDTSQSVVLLI